MSSSDLPQGTLRGKERGEGTQKSWKNGTKRGELKDNSLLGCGTQWVGHPCPAVAIKMQERGGGGGQKKQEKRTRVDLSLVTTGFFAPTKKTSSTGEK